MDINDDTLFPYGEYRFTRMSKVPADYLLKLSGKKANLSKPFIKYIKDNLHIIQSKVETNEIETVSLICKKILYINEKIAKIALSRIKEIEQGHKKPIRAYECEVCGGWHLTSIPLDVFKVKTNVE